MNNLSSDFPAHNLTNQIKAIALAAFDSGLSVVIDRRLPTIAIDVSGNPDDGYFFQGSEADGILHEADEQSGMYDVSTEEYLAFVSQSW